MTGIATPHFPLGKKKGFLERSGRMKSSRMEMAQKMIKSTNSLVVVRKLSGRVFEIRCKEGQIAVKHTLIYF